MVSSVLVYGKKIYSLALIFNSLLSITWAIGLLVGVYAEDWKLYEPYLIDGALFWAIIPASIMNIFPALRVGRVKTGRLWFHHYVYGFVVMVLSAALLLMFTAVSPIGLFTANTTDVTINAGRFFILGGLTLFLDDFADISEGTRFILNLVEKKAYQRRRMIHAVQWLMGFVSSYLFLCVSIYVTQNPEWGTLANYLLMGTLLVTSLTSFVSANQKTWLSISPQRVQDDCSYTLE
jgi:hypothetical protein